MKRLNELIKYKNSMGPMPTWIKPSTANKLNMNDINESYWLEQNLYRTWENWPKVSKWSIPESAEGKNKRRWKLLYASQADHENFQTNF